MILYIPAPSAQALSVALSDLSRPPWVRDAADSKYLFGWVDDTQGARWLVVDTEYEIPVHAEAELAGIAEILKPFVDAGDLPADTNVQLAALVESLRGKRLVVWDAFPQFFKDKSKDMKGMIEAGLLPVITL